MTLEEHLQCGPECRTGKTDTLDMTKNSTELFEVDKIKEGKTQRQKERTKKKNEPHRVAANAAKAQGRGPRRYLADTGSPYDLISRRPLQGRPKDDRRIAEDVILLTANGPMDVHESVQLKCEGLSERIEPLLLEETPVVISIGRRCVKYGYGFHWEPYSRKPYLIKPNGKRIYLYVEHYVPYVPNHKYDNAQPKGSDQLPASAVVIEPQGHTPDDKSTTASSNESDASSSSGPTLRKSPALPGEDAEADADAEDEEYDHERVDWKAEAQSLRHLMTHTPAIPKYCEVCRVAKAIEKHARVTSKVKKTLPTKPLERVTGDFWLSKDDRSLGINGEKYGLVLFDIFSKFLFFDAQGNRDTAHQVKAFNDFAGPEPGKKIKSFYSDNAPELIAACRLLGINHALSVPYRSISNAIAERRIRIAKEGGRVALAQSGAPTSLWPYAVEHFCHSLNTGMLGDSNTAWELRFRTPFEGKRIPFGALVKFKPNRAYKQPVMSERLIDGLFLGWNLNPGGVFKGYYLCCPLEDLEKKDKSRDRLSGSWSLVRSSLRQTHQSFLASWPEILSQSSLRILPPIPSPWLWPGTRRIPSKLKSFRRVKQGRARRALTR